LWGNTIGGDSAAKPSQVATGNDAVRIRGWIFGTAGC